MAVIVLPVIAIILLILSSRIDTYLYFGKSFYFEIHFTLFALRFKKNEGKRRRSPIKKLLKSLPVLKKTLEKLLSKSKTTLIDVNQSERTSTSTENTRTQGLIKALLIIPYLKSRSKEFYHLTYPATEDYNSLTLIFSFKAYNLFISVLFFLYYKLKALIRRKIRV